MNTALVTRMRRLEGHTLFDNPYARLSDNDLDARLKKITANIEDRVGMPVSEYVAELQTALDAGEALPEGWSNDDARGFIVSLRKVATMRSADVY